MVEELFGVNAGNRARPADDAAMKLPDVDLEELVQAIWDTQAAWNAIRREEKREATDPELVTVCILQALANVFRIARGHVHKSNDWWQRQHPSLPLGEVNLADVDLEQLRSAIETTEDGIGLIAAPACASSSPAT